MKGFYSFFIFTIALLLCANKMSAFDFEVDGILYSDNCNPDIGLIVSVTYGRNINGDSDVYNALRPISPSSCSCPIAMSIVIFTIWRVK